MGDLSRVGWNARARSVGHAGVPTSAAVWSSVLCSWRHGTFRRLSMGWPYPPHAWSLDLSCVWSHSAPARRIAARGRPRTARARTEARPRRRERSSAPSMSGSRPPASPVSPQSPRIGLKQHRGSAAWWRRRWRRGVAARRLREVGATGRRHRRCGATVRHLVATGRRRRRCGAAARHFVVTERRRRSCGGKVRRVEVMAREKTGS